MRRVASSHYRWTAGAAARLSVSAPVHIAVGVTRPRRSCGWSHHCRPSTRNLTTSTSTSIPSASPSSSPTPFVNNVTPDILAKVGRSLHRLPHHPLCIIRERIIDYFQRRFPSPPSSFRFFDDLHPSVSVQQNFDDLLVPPLHPSRRITDTVTRTDALTRSLIRATHVYTNPTQICLHRRCVADCAGCGVRSCCCTVVWSCSFTWIPPSAFERTRRLTKRSSSVRASVAFWCSVTATEETKSTPPTTPCSIRWRECACGR